MTLNDAISEAAGHADAALDEFKFLNRNGGVRYAEFRDVYANAFLTALADSGYDVVPSTQQLPTT